MSDLKMYEKTIFEKLFDRGGYVLDFSDATFAEFFRENNINIEAEKYHKNGRSKMKRLRAFWEIEPNKIVGNVLDELLKYANNIGEISHEDNTKALQVVNRLLGKNTANHSNYKELFPDDDLLHIDISKLNLDQAFNQVIKSRLNEIREIRKRQAPLATIFLCGSILEGILLDVACANLAPFNKSKSAPKDEGKNKLMNKWGLEDLINVSHEIGLIDLSIKEFSKSLKGFRNYIHPREQIAKRFDPNMETADICCRVLIATISQLNSNIPKLKSL